MNQNLKPKSIAIVGRIFEPLVQALAESEDNTKHFQSFHDYLLFSPSFRADALVLDARQTQFPDVQALSALLDKCVSLCVYSPTSESIDVIKAATKSRQDLAGYQYGEGVPLIVHGKRGHIQFIPGFQSNVPLEERNRALKTLELLRLPISYAASSSDPIVLVPPSGTNFFHQESITFDMDYFCDYRPWDTKNDWTVYSNTDYQVFHLQWTLNFYIYAADCNPGSSDFATKGTVWTVITHEGFFRRKQDSNGRYFHHGYSGNSESQYYFVDRLRFSIKDEAALMTICDVLPDSLSQDDGDYIQHSISWQKTMNLFKDKGKNTFSFDAKYSTSFSRYQFEQHSEKDSNEGIMYYDFSKYYKRKNGLSNKTWATVDSNDQGIFYTDNQDKIRVREFPEDYHNIYGLTVFSSKLATPNLRLQFEPEVIAFRSKTAWEAGPASYGILQFDEGLGHIVGVDLTFDAEVKKYAGQSSDTPAAYSKDDNTTERHSTTSSFQS